MCCCLAQRNKICQTLANQTIPTGCSMKPLLVLKEGTKLLLTVRDFLWFLDIIHSLSKINGLQSDSLFLPILEVTIPFFFFFFADDKCVCAFSLSPAVWYKWLLKTQQDEKSLLDTNGPFEARLLVINLRDRKNSIWCLRLQCVCVCVESPPYNCSSLQVRWSYALLRRIVWGDICLSQWSSGIFGGHEINCSSEQTLDQQMNKFYPQAPTIAASRAEQSRLSSLLSLRCQLGDYWVDLIPLIRISSDTTRRMATFKSDI